MKKITFIASAFLLVILTACGPSQNDAIKYNDSIMDLVEGLTVDHTLFLNQIDGHNIDSLKLTYKLFSDKTKSSLDAGKKVGPFAGKTAFSDVVVQYFTTMNAIAENEGKQMVDIMSKDTAQITQQDLDKITDLAAAFDEKYSVVYDKIKEAQQKFSEEWKFSLMENKK